MLAKTDTVDLIVRDPQSGAYELVLAVESGEWAAPNALQQLKDKIDGTSAFALDGELYERHPDARGKPIALNVLSVDPVPPFFTKWLDAIAEVLAKDGLSLIVTRAPHDQAA